MVPLCTPSTRVSILKMNILVTGGNGGVGRAVVQCLQSQHHQVRIFDRSAAQTPLAETQLGDLTNYAQVRAAMNTIDAVVHLGALTYPAAGPAHEIHQINVGGSFNVYAAAAEAGIKRVVSASSINALGYNFGVRDFPIRFLPLDESHESFTTDAYSFSKQSLEAIAAYFWRRDNISGVQLRLPFVYSAAEWFHSSGRDIAVEHAALRAQFLASSAADLRSAADTALARRAQIRSQRMTEHPEMPFLPTEGPPDLATWLAFGHTDFWAVISAEDAAQAFERALCAKYDGSHPLYVCEAENMLGVPSAQLAQLFFADSALMQPIDGTATLLSHQRAAQLLGYAPTMTFRRWLAAGSAT
jgi:nucleoside-diphosphate-sugar epimerase